MRVCGAGGGEDGGTSGGADGSAGGGASGGAGGSAKSSRASGEDDSAVNLAGVLHSTPHNARAVTRTALNIFTIGVSVSVVIGTMGGVTAAVPGSSGCGAGSLEGGVRIRLGGVLGNRRGAACARPGRIAMDTLANGD